MHRFWRVSTAAAPRSGAHAWTSFRRHAPSQVVNSVLMDDVRTGPNCAIHNCVLSAGCVLGEGARLRDCQLAPGYAVPAGAELTEEVLPPPVLRD